MLDAPAFWPQARNSTFGVRSTTFDRASSAGAGQTNPQSSATPATVCVS
jgi:hypothetical protein